MNKELIDRAWACLPREFKEKVKKEYYHDDSNPFELAQLEAIFGIHNLTSDAEGEEMLCVKASKVREMYALNEKILYLDSTHKGAILLKKKLTDLFGSKCLPNELNEDNFATKKPKPAAPKFRKDEKVRIKGVAGFDVIKDIYGTGKDGYRYELAHEIAIYDESDLEPYTEPEDEGTRQEQYVPKNAESGTHSFSHILKDDFRDHNRLHIAAMAMQGLISKTPRFSSYEISNLVRISLDCADALISKCKKGGENA